MTALMALWMAWIAVASVTLSILGTSAIIKHIEKIRDKYRDNRTY
jgi:hypothetical protein